MAKARSPNYPVISLSAALEAVRPAFKSENRNKMSRKVLAKHLGYNGLNGRALGKIGAIRAYGLIEGSGDELRIAEDAISALVAPEASGERQSAIQRLALRPALFADLRKEFPDSLPSIENLKFQLVKRQFTEVAAEKAAKTFLATMHLATGAKSSYNPVEEENEGEEDVPPEVGDLIQVEIDGVFQLSKPARIRAIQEHEGETWVFLEGSETGVPMEQIVVEQKVEGGGKVKTPPPILPLEKLLDEPLPKGARKEVTSLDEGAATLTWPDELSKESVADLEHWLSGILRKAKRRAGVSEDKKDEAAN